MSEPKDAWDEYMNGCSKRVENWPIIIALPMLVAAAFVGGIICLLFVPLRKW